MFLNKCTLSLRTQVMLYFAVLFVGTAAVTIIFVGHNLYQLLIRRVDQNLEELIQRCQTDYVVGKNARHLGIEFPVYDLQADLLAAFDRHLPGFAALAAYEPAQSDPYSSPTVFGCVDDKIYLMRRSSTGQVYSRELNPQPNVHLVRRRLLLGKKAHGDKLLFYLVSSGGKKLAVSENFPLKNALPAPGVPVTGNKARMIVKRFPDGTTLAVGRKLTEIHLRVEHYCMDFIVIGLPILFIGLLSAWVISGRVAGGIRKVGEAASDIAGGNYSRRVAGHYHGQEMAGLISAFNKMSANTERLLNELRGATDDVAHDLKTPLTRIRGLAEVTVRGPQDFELWSDALGSIAEECDDMVAIINTMLEITRTESNIGHFSPEDVDFRALLHRLGEFYHPAAEERGLQWVLDIPDEPVVLRADRLKIQRMLGNLLDNALKFVPEGGMVTLRLSVREKDICLQVIDNGPGIPDQDKVRIFERFVRLDRSRTCRGNGLGLAMVRAVAVVHQGHVTISDTPGGGATFTVVLPRCAGNGRADEKMQKNCG